MKKTLLLFISLIFVLNSGLIFSSCGGKEEKAETPTPQAEKTEERELPAIVITEPRFTELSVTTSSTISLAGLTVKELESVNWANNRGGSGTANGTINWRVPEMALQPGENIITISAKDKNSAEIYTTEMKVTYKPLELLGTLAVKPDLIYIDDETEIIVEIPITPSPKLNKNKVEIYRTYEDGKNMYLLGLLTDDGASNNGDKVAGDNVWSCKFTLARGKESEEGVKRVGQTADELSQLWGLFDKDVGEKISVGVSAYLTEEDDSFVTSYSNLAYISVDKR